MLNRNKALINFIGILITSYICIIVFLILGLTVNDFIGISTGTSVAQLAGIAFGISFIVMLISNTAFTLPFANEETVKKSPLAILITALLMSVAVAFSVGVIASLADGVHGVQGNVLEIIVLIVFIPSVMILAALLQESNTKFLMVSIASNRADEWEYTNFWELSRNKISVTHGDSLSTFKHKGKTTIVSFFSEENVERKIYISGDSKTITVKQIEESLDEGQKGAIVYLSNTLPTVVGKNDKVEVIKQKDLFKFVKLEKVKKQK